MKTLFSLVERGVIGALRSKYHSSTARRRRKTASARLPHSSHDSDGICDRRACLGVLCHGHHGWVHNASAELTVDSRPAEMPINGVAVELLI